MRRIVLVVLLLLIPSPVLSDGTLTALVNQAWLTRTEDASLHDIAHQRAVEIASDWSHNGQRPGTAEVLAYNQGFADPASKAIGCAEDDTGNISWFACVLAGEPVEAARTPNPTPVGAIPTAGATPPPQVTPAPVLLPNTATEEP
jgi:hypothetical protein